MKHEHVIQFSDQNFTVTVTHEIVQGGYHHVSVHKLLESTMINSRFDLFLTDEQFKGFANFLWFLTSKESS